MSNTNKVNLGTINIKIEQKGAVHILTTVNNNTDFSEKSKYCLANYIGGWSKKECIQKAIDRLQQRGFAGKLHIV